MANVLTLKVSEEKYRTAIQQLGDKLNTLNGYLTDIQGKRAELERNYTGPQAAKAIATIKENEAQVRKAIENVKSHKEKIQAYLDSMSRADTEIQANFDEAANLAKSIFD